MIPCLKKLVRHLVEYGKRQEVLGPFLIPQGVVEVGDVLGAKEDPGLLCKGPWHPARFHPHRKRVKNKEPVKLLFEFPESGTGCLGSIFFAPCRLERRGHCS